MVCFKEGGVEQFAVSWLGKTYIVECESVEKFLVAESLGGRKIEVLCGPFESVI